MRVQWTLDHNDQVHIEIEAVHERVGELFNPPPQISSLPIPSLVYACMFFCLGWSVCLRVQWTLDHDDQVHIKHIEIEAVHERVGYIAVKDYF